MIEFGGEKVLWMLALQVYFGVLINLLVLRFVQNLKNTVASVQEVF